MDGMAKQLKKGVLEIIILKILATRDCYGYEIIKELSVLSNGYFELKEGTLYPLLYRLNTKGLIESYWGNEENNAARRKYYLITESGKSKLRESETRWREFIAAVNLILNITVKEGGE